MHVVALKLPEPLLLKVTVPVGVIFVPAEVSVKVAVQVVGAFTASLVGAHVTAVLLVRLFTMRLKVLKLVE